MRAVVIEGAEGAASLTLGEVPAPVPGPGELGVEVQAAGLNRADILQALGRYPAPPGAPRLIPGLEYAGVVRAVGPGCRQAFQEGDRVFGIAAGGALAEQVVVPESLALRIPGNLDAIEAAAVPESFVTAHDALCQGGFHAGCNVLIHTAGGGVGLAAVQVAHALGGRVIGLSRSSAKLEKAREHGLDVPIGLEDENTPFEQLVLEATGGVGVETLIDFLGARYLQRNLACLGWRGTLVVVGLLSGARANLDLAALMSKRLRVVGTVLRSRPLEEKAEATQAFAAEVLPLIATGRIRPVVDRVFPLADIRRAAEYMQSNQAFGKIVMSVA